MKHLKFCLKYFSALMLNAGIPDIAIEPDKTLQKLRDKLKLELDDEEAVKESGQVLEFFKVKFN